MMRASASGVAVLLLLVSTSPIQAQSAAHYRDFQFGDSLASVAASAGVAASEAKAIHTRPVLRQDLEWRRPYTGNRETPDAVQQIAFSFYSDQLFRLVIDYDRDRTEGMTDADMVEAISSMYGATIKPASRATRAPLAATDEESGTRVAAWGNAEFTAVLYRSSYASGFRMIVTSVRLNALARTAAAQALRLDERDAPQRERARQRKEADDERASKEKARTANRASFKP